MSGEVVPPILTAAEIDTMREWWPQGDIRRLMASHEALRAELVTTRQQLRQEIAAVDEHSHTLAEVRAENERLRQALAVLHGEIETVWRPENTALRAALTDLADETENVLADPADLWDKVARARAVLAADGR